MSAFNVLRKIKRKLQWGTNDLLWNFHLKSKSFRTKPFQRIFAYHGIDDHGNTSINSRFTSKSDLEKHFAFFSQYWHVISVNDFFQKKFHPTKPTIAITFDDGYENNYTAAFPLLKKYTIPASFYVTTIRDAGQDILWPDLLDLSSHCSSLPFTYKGDEFVQKSNKQYYHVQSGKDLKNYLKSFDNASRDELLQRMPGSKLFRANESLMPYWKLLTYEQIAEMSKHELATIGSHGYYHNCLERVSSELAKKEILDSKNALESIINQPIHEIAYPDGTYTSELVDYAKSIGLTRQLLGASRMENTCDESYIHIRMSANPHISFNNQMNAFLAGNYK